jgi:Uma2 family endonuclease
LRGFIIVANQAAYLSEAEYLAQEAKSQVKHEYVAGYVYAMGDIDAMAGASGAHNKIAFNLTGLLYGQLRHSGCSGYGSDMKVKIAARQCFYYPDLHVTCDARDRNNAPYNEYPKLIIEVLSDATEQLDRGDKFFDYQELDSLEEYILISQDKMRVEVLRRNGAGRWELYVFREGQQVELASVQRGRHWQWLRSMKLRSMKM